MRGSRNVLRLLGAISEGSCIARRPPSQVRVPTSPKGSGTPTREGGGKWSHRKPHLEEEEEEEEKRRRRLRTMEGRMGVYLSRTGRPAEVLQNPRRGPHGGLSGFRSVINKRPSKREDNNCGSRNVFRLLGTISEGSCIARRPPPLLACMRPRLLRPLRLPAQ